LKKTKKSGVSSGRSSVRYKRYAATWVEAARYRLVER